LEEGWKLLKPKSEISSKRIFIFSDGLVNEGLKEHKQIFNLVHTIHEEKINVSAYGIGADFDENLMKGIAEYGVGDFFFIDSASKIQEIVAKGLSGLISLIGTNGVLQIRGLNGAVVKKIFMHDDIIKGAQVNDLRENDLRQIIAEVEVSPSTNSEGASIEFASWTLSYIPQDEITPVALTGTVDILTTNEATKASQENNKVIVSHLIALNGENDNEVMALLDAGKITEAMAKKKSTCR